MWTITHRGRKATATTHHVACAATIAAFFKACDTGEPGRYTLRSAEDFVLATGDVKAHEMTLKWHRDHIMYALGREGAADEIGPAGNYLSEIDK